MKSTTVWVQTLVLLCGMGSGSALADGQAADRMVSVAAGPEVAADQGGYAVALRPSAAAGSMPAPMAGYNYAPPGPMANQDMPPYRPVYVPGTNNQYVQWVPTFVPPEPVAGFSAVGDGAIPAHACCPAPRFIVTADAMALHRSRPSSRVLVEDFVSGEEILNSRDVKAEWGVGPRIDAIWNFHPGWQIEGVYFGIDNWHGDRSVSGEGLLVPPLGEAELFNGVTAEVGTDLYSAELNLRRSFGPRFTMLAGFRFLELREVASLVGITPQAVLGTSAKVNNDLYGFQIGGNLTVGRQISPFYIDSFLKAGVYSNHAERGITDFGPGGTTYDEVKRHHVAFVGEVGAMPTYRFSNYLSAFGGYEFLCVQGVALAADQLGSTAPLRTAKTAFYHGARVGLEARW